MTNDEFEFGISKHAGVMLVSLVDAVWEHYVRMPQLEVNEPEKAKRLRPLLGENRLRNLMTGNTGSGMKYDEIVKRTYTRSANEMSREDFEKAVAEKEIDFEVVKRLDDLAIEVNSSIRRAVFEDAPFEWRRYLEAALEMGDLIYGKEGSEPSKTAYRHLRALCPTAD